MMFLCYTNLILIALTWQALYQKQHTYFKSVVYLFIFLLFISFEKTMKNEKYLVLSIKNCTI